MSYLKKEKMRSERRRRPRERMERKTLRHARILLLLSMAAVAFNWVRKDYETLKMRGMVTSGAARSEMRARHSE